MLDQFYWKCEYLPNYRHTSEVKRILNEDPAIQKKENSTQEQIEENEKWWADLRASPVAQFLSQAEEIPDKLNELERKKNSTPYRREDKKLWQALPNVIGLDGKPMPRESIKSKGESDDKFWDFARRFFFGLWGFQQWPYPPGRPIDVAQAIGYKKLEKQYYDCFPLRTALLLVVIFSLSSIFSCLYRWDKLHSLRLSDPNLEADGDQGPSKPKVLQKVSFKVINFSDQI
ncbi:TIC 56, chloroplastic [Olea europaea subsp. europaea]|uniref:TIC 56, chloroplastic n=1 Tax=Olea europaea subsp. europaea TaxID=158383 RepID=A0A8S0R290_OLEEU|nr:TIC 56, chloroplastic [Olea europaea subsp. europaea]